MNPERLYSTLREELEQIVEAKTFKYEVPLESQQGGRVKVNREDGRDVVMLASNNYLGLANHPRVKEAARHGLDEWGFGNGQAFDHHIGITLRRSQANQVHV